jgi:hypothetical protein
MNASPRHRALQWLARSGYAARGAVFVILSYFTTMAALETFTRPIDGKDALAALLQAPLGGVLLGVITVGLFCFAIWREAQGFLDVDHFGSDWKGLPLRPTSLKGVVWLMPNRHIEAKFRDRALSAALEG